MSYAIDSYYAAWLHTHYEKEWLSTILQSENSSPKGLEKTISEIKSYGYKFSPSDVNYSGNEWEYSDEAQAFVPPLSSVKGVGDTAMEEIMMMRPYKNVYDLLYDEDGTWKHSKMNKTAFRSLCKVEAFGSLEELKSGEIPNHRQLLAVLTEDKNYETLRKGQYGITKTQVKRAKKNGEILEPILDKLRSAYEGLPDWNRTEKITNYMDLTSSVNNSLVFPEALVERIRKKNIGSVFSVPAGQRGVGWFCVTDIIAKVTKNGKPFYRFKGIDKDNNTGWVRVWGKFSEAPDLYTIWVADVHNDANWGMSTSSYKMKRVTAYD